MSDSTLDIGQEYQILKQAFTAYNEDIIAAVVEACGAFTVLNTHLTEHRAEIFCQPTTVTDDERERLETVFPTVREIGVYGDPDLRGTDEACRNDGDLYIQVELP